MKRHSLLAAPFILLALADSSDAWTVTHQIRQVQASAIDTYADAKMDQSGDFDEFSTLVQTQSLEGLEDGHGGIEPGNVTGFALASQHSKLLPGLLQASGALEGGTFGGISTSASSDFEVSFVVDFAQTAWLDLQLQFPGALASFASFKLAIDRTNSGGFTKILDLAAEQGESADLAFDPEFLPGSVFLSLQPGEYHLAAHFYQQGDEFLSFNYDVKLALASAVVPLPSPLVMTALTLAGLCLTTRARLLA